MKYLIPLLLLCAFCRAQQYADFDYTKVTAYRMMDIASGKEHNAVLEYVNSQKYVGLYIQAQQSTDRPMAYELLRLKRESTNWQRISLVDTPAVFYARNMIVVQVNQYKDTLYTDTALRYLYNPKEEALYADTTAQITAAFNPEMKTFFERDFEKEFEHHTDSVTLDKVKVNGKSVYGLSHRGFEKKVGHFQIARTDSIFGGEQVAIRQEFIINNLRFQFDGPKKQLNNITAVKIDHTFEQQYDIEVDGIKLGDAEDKLYERYPNATRIRNWGAPLNNITDNYYYSIEFTGSEGYAIFYIRKGVISEIEVTF
jgi:hypothetical protein